MHGALTFSYELHDGADRLDPRAWRAALECALTRSGEGLVVCDAELEILFCTARASHLLGRLGMGPDRVLPEAVASAASAQLARGDSSHVDRASPPRGGSAVYVQATPLRGAPPARVAIWLREEILRDDLLFASLKAQFAISPRGFQLAQLVRKGLSNRVIAAQLHLAESTVKSYLHRLYRECGVSSRTGLVALLGRLSG